MSKPNGRRIVMWGHLALLGVMTVVVIGYLLDARATSLKINNLLLVQPAAILALILVALILPQVFPKLPAADVPDKEDNRRARVEVARVGLLAAAFGLFVFSLEAVGFDVATFCFVAIGLYVCGERRLWVVGVYSAVFTALVVYGYQQLVPYPFPMTFL
jgi:hypothetical protein